MIILLKEQFDDNIIDSALKKVAQNEVKELKTHLVYTGTYYYYHEDLLRSFILVGMKKYKIKSIMLTIIRMWRWRIISKNTMEIYCKGEKFSSVEFYENYVNDSVNDDLESLFKDLRLGKVLNEKTHIYYLPKLTEKEEELAEGKDTSYYKTFQCYRNSEMLTDKMKRSTSDSKYVLGEGCRRTFTIENPFL